MKGIHREGGGLYILKSEFGVKNTLEGQKKLVVGLTIHDRNLWHNKLSRPSAHVLRSLDLLIYRKDAKLLNKCHFCPLTKLTRLPYLVRESKSSMCFDVVYMDMWGPYKTPTFDKNIYFLKIMDDCSRYTLIHLLQLKSECIAALKDFLLMIKTQFRTSVKVVLIHHIKMV